MLYLLIIVVIVAACLFSFWLVKKKKKSNAVFESPPDPVSIDDFSEVYIPLGLVDDPERIKRKLRGTKRIVYKQCEIAYGSKEKIPWIINNVSVVDSGQNASLDIDSRKISLRPHKKMFLRFAGKVHDVYRSQVLSPGDSEKEIIEAWIDKKFGAVGEEN